MKAALLAALVFFGSASVVSSSAGLTGPASWYRWHPGEAAAGPGLRAALGPDWRGRLVVVTRAGSSVTVRLTDWCGCPGGRLIDLDSRAFAALAPLSRGVIQVRIAPVTGGLTTPAPSVSIPVERAARPAGECEGDRWQQPRR